LLGWSVEVVQSKGAHFANALKQDHRCIILGCCPEALSSDEAKLLLDNISAAPVMLITRLGCDATPLDSGVRSGVAHGKCLAWEGPGQDASWNLRKEATLEGITPGQDGWSWASLNGVSIIAARRIQHGTIATLAFHPSSARDSAGYFTALLRHLLIFGPIREVSWLKLVNTLVLRMDDPGGAQNVHNGSWAHCKLNRSAWREVSRDLAERRARLSIAYVSGWVDDGDAIRGVLRIHKKRVGRCAGKIYPSALVEYRDLAGHSPGRVHDYVDEFAGIQDLRRAGVGEVELHGYTHMHPDHEQWMAACDKYQNNRWYREFGAEAARYYVDPAVDRHPLARAMLQVERWFGTRPSTLIFPGDEWTDASVEVALDLGLDLISSYYLALRDNDRFCWATHVCAPYLDLAQADWFDAGLPVVGYFHDRDLAVNGTRWMREWLDRWIAAGAHHLVDFRTLTNYLAVAERSGLKSQPSLPPPTVI
jgi:hypothetical protein